MIISAAAGVAVSVSVSPETVDVGLGALIVIECERTEKRVCVCVCIYGCVSAETTAMTMKQRVALNFVDVYNRFLKMFQWYNYCNVI